MAEAIAIAKGEAAEQVKSIQADLAEKLKVTKGSYNITAQQATLEAQLAVNRTRNEVAPARCSHPPCSMPSRLSVTPLASLSTQATQEIKSAEEAKSAALAALPAEEVKLKRAKESLATANKALALAQKNRAYMRAWTQNQLATALRAVKRAADASKSVAAKAAAVKKGATLVTP